MRAKLSSFSRDTQKTTEKNSVIRHTYRKDSVFMTKKTVAVICAAGVGDALIMLIASHHFQQAGYAVTTFTHHLAGFGPWLKDFTFQRTPDIEEYAKVFAPFDLVIHQHENSQRAKALFDLRGKGVLKKLIVFYNNYRTTKHAPLHPEFDFAFDESRSMAHNVAAATQKLLHLPAPSKEIGMTIPEGLIHRRYSRRVVIHPTSSTPKKNWWPKKFEALARKLRSRGYEPVFTVSKEERPHWLALQELGFGVPLITSLADLAKLIYESGYFIGNDSGPGHLASYLQIPSIILAPLKQSITHWRPDWLPSKVLLPLDWIPNLKGFRLREEKWQLFISVGRVLRTFHSLPSA